MSWLEPLTKPAVNKHKASSSSHTANNLEGTQLSNNPWWRERLEKGLPVPIT
jgi:hypothetical protein